MIQNPLANVRDEIAKLPGLRDHRTNWWAGISGFRARMGRAFRIVVEEPEILVFAVLQWLVIAAGYVAWFQILHFLPDEPAGMPSPTGAGGGFGTIFAMLFVGSVWTIAILVLVALPVGVLSAAMGAAHLLRRTGQVSTAGRCLGLALRQVLPLWTYHAIDGYITVNAVLARLPKRHRNRSTLEMIAQETLYFAWKLGCAGVLPAMISGHGLIESGRRSLAFVKAKLGELAVLRAGYGGLCWAIGALAYALSFIIVFDYAHAIPKWMLTGSELDSIVLLTGLPLMSALAIILIVLQPIYILAVCDLYADHLEEKGETLNLTPAEPLAQPVAMEAIVYLAVALLAAICAHQLGVDEWMGFTRGAA